MLLNCVIYGKNLSVDLHYITCLLYTSIEQLHSVLVNAYYRILADIESLVPYVTTFMKVLLCNLGRQDVYKRQG